MAKQGRYMLDCKGLNVDTLEPILYDLLRHVTIKTHHQYYQYYSQLRKEHSRKY